MAVKNTKATVSNTLKNSLKAKALEEAKKFRSSCQKSLKDGITQFASYTVSAVIDRVFDYFGAA